MSSRTSNRSLKAANLCRCVKREGAGRVTAALEAVLNSTTGIPDPIMEQLKRVQKHSKSEKFLAKCSTR